MTPDDSGPGGGDADSDDGALSLRRERFCQAFVRHGNAARAAREAGYAAASAKQRGHRLLALAPVRARIGVLAAAADEAGAGEARVLTARLDVLFEQALDARAFHAAARALELQARLTAPPLVPPAPSKEEHDDAEIEAMIARAEAVIADIVAGGEEEGDDRG